MSQNKKKFNFPDADSINQEVTKIKTPKQAQKVLKKILADMEKASKEIAEIIQKEIDGENDPNRKTVLETLLAERHPLIFKGKKNDIH